MRRIAVEKTKGLIPPKGLPSFSVTGSNTLVVFATASGDTASDGQGRNSPFTASLLKHIETPGLEFEQMLKRVTTGVVTDTQGRQQPERLSRLQTEIVLAPQIGPWRADASRETAAMRKRMQELEDELKKRKQEPDCDKPLSFACVKQKKAKGFLITDLSSVTCRKEVIYKASDPALKWKAIWTTSFYSYKEDGKGPGGGLYNELLKVGGWGDYYHSLIQFEPEVSLPPNFAGLFLYAKSSGGQPVSMYLDRIVAPWSWEKGDRLWWKDKPNATQHYGGELPPPEPGKWYLIDVTGLYHWWLDANQPNYGIQLRPTGNGNQHNFFASGLEFERRHEAAASSLLLTAAVHLNP